MFGDGSSGRDYTYCADIVNDIVAALRPGRMHSRVGILCAGDVLDSTALRMNEDHSDADSYDGGGQHYSGRTNKGNLWEINTEQEYHEENSG